MIFDPRSERNLKTLELKAQRRFRLWFEDVVNYVTKKHTGVSVRVLSGHRTWAQQDELYKQGRTKPGPIVTNAKGGQSNHNFSIAIDLGLFKGTNPEKYLDETAPVLAEKIYKEIASDISDYGMEWGGNWPGSLQDHPHFQIYVPLTKAEMRAKYQRTGSVL